MAIISGDCRRITCPPDRPNKQVINGQCFCTQAVPGGGVERMTARYPVSPRGPQTYAARAYQPTGSLQPADLGVGMNGCPSCGMNGLGALDETLSMAINLAVLGLAAYGAYHLFVK